MRPVLNVLGIAALHFFVRTAMLFIVDEVGGSLYVLVARILSFPLNLLWGSYNTLQDRILLSLFWGLVVYVGYRFANRRA